MNKKSIFEVKNRLNISEQLTVSQQCLIRGGDGEDDEEKRREAARTSGTGTTTKSSTPSAPTATVKES